jgi:glycosyltransferase involved in cell wall biosynthesis
MVTDLRPSPELGATERKGLRMRLTVSMIVPVYNASAYLDLTIPTFLAAVEAWPGAELIIVDNGSSDGSWEYVRAIGHPAVRALQKRDAHVGEVRNQGAAVAHGEILVFVDADCLVPPDHLTTVASAFADTGAEAVGAYYAMSPQPSWIEHSWHMMHAPATDGPAAWVPAGNMAIRRQAFERLAGFRGDLTSGEDVDLCYRLEKMGTPVFQDRRIHASHLGNPRTARQFIRKHAWHGEGMLAAGPATLLNRPTVMTLAHWTLVLGGVVLVAVARPSALLSASILVLCLTGVPIVSVLYRSLQKRRFVNPVTSVAAYFLYYIARAISLKRLLWRRLRQSA